MSDKHTPGPILVPVDFSAPSEAALLCALELGRCLQRPVQVLHVIHDPASMPGYYSRALKKKQLTRIEDGAAEMLDEFLQRVANAHRDMIKRKQLESMLVSGLPSSRILEVAHKINASMIVMGSMGLTGWKHLLIGSVAEQVVHLAPMPVTVVKSDPHQEG
ncbi:universal stress protein [Halochromatium roseum]|uniref:universal stress protein n=1 Tax=Halochromatium roseum TaxID=391920 RepID=UPI0019113A0E|nr:universal stress protein [Halochromatium roseum]MBK5939435.1 universal stress protein UspA [Halochromatium roseum]